MVRCVHFQAAATHFHASPAQFASTKGSLHATRRQSVVLLLQLLLFIESVPGVAEREIQSLKKRRTAEDPTKKKHKIRCVEKKKVGGATAAHACIHRNRTSSQPANLGRCISVGTVSWNRRACLSASTHPA